jgi:hypothetical protein
MKSWLILFLILFWISFVSSAAYGVGDYGEGIYSIGETAPVDEDDGGGGGGCYYNWTCTNWFPSECSIDGFQERICINTGTCTGTSGMPEQKRNCTYEHGEPLFDIFVNLQEDYRKICAGSKLKVKVGIENFGKAELLDAFMTYWIVDENNTLIAEMKDTRSVTKNLNFEISMNVPPSTPDGTYRLYAQINYGENKTALAGESFEVRKDSCTFFSGFAYYLPMIIFGLIIAIISVTIILLAIELNHKIRVAKNRED